MRYVEATGRNISCRVGLRESATHHSMGRGAVDNWVLFDFPDFFAHMGRDLLRQFG
jgi:hypothetical protein